MMRGYSKDCSCLHCDGVRRDAEEDAKPMYVQTIPLDRASFCPDCNCFVGSLIACNCGNRSLMTMANVMNREVA